MGHPTTAGAWQQAPSSAEVRVLRSSGGLELSWSDAEDTLIGALRPPVPRSDAPIQVSLKVGTFEGRPFEGPVTVSLRRSDDRVADVRVLPFTGRGWSTEFRVDKGGPYELDVGFQTTRHKTVRARFEVIHAASVPEAVQWGVVALVGAIALGIGLRMVRRWPKVGGNATPG